MLFKDYFVICDILKSVQEFALHVAGNSLTDKYPRGHQTYKNKGEETLTKTEQGS